MPGVDEVHSRRERDKLTVAKMWADLGIIRRTFYEWRAKGRAPRVHHAAEWQPARPPVRVPAVAAIILPEEFWT